MNTLALNDADEFATGTAAADDLTLDSIGHLLVMAIYENAGDIEKAIQTLERITITLAPCQLGTEAKEVFAGAIETLDNHRGFDIKRGFE